MHDTYLNSFINEKTSLKEKMLNATMAQWKNTNEEKSQPQPKESYSHGGPERVTRSAKRLHKDPTPEEVLEKETKKRFIPPSISYRLRESEIYDDLRNIRTASITVRNQLLRPKEVTVKSDRS
jgi:hypothetical protein